MLIISTCSVSTDSGVSAICCFPIYFASNMGADGCVVRVDSCDDITYGCWVLEVCP